MRLFRPILAALALVFSLRADNAEKTLRLPSPAAVADAVRAIHMSPHPLLFADAAGFDAVRAFTATNELGRLALGRLRFEADQFLTFPPCERKMEGRRLLGVSRQVLHRVTVLAMAYRLTGHVPYLERAAAEMRAAAGFTDWNPSHFLDVAEMTLALAAGYDWLYADLDAQTRETVSAAILEKGLLTSQKHTGWVKASNNWGQVCHAGMMAGAFALMDRQPDLAAEIVHRAITHLPLSMRAYDPNGSYPEGPGYWSYGTDFNVLALSLLDGILKSDFGLTNLPCFWATADYPDTVTGPSDMTFNYADGGMGRSTDCATWWFAKRLNRPDLLAYFEADAFTRYCSERKPFSSGGHGDRLFAFTFFWLRPVDPNARPQAPLQWTSAGKVPVAIHRSSWDNAEAVFVGLKAGSPSGPHGHMDAGSFVLDAHGVRWAYDLGAESYHRIESRKMDLWNSKQDSDRWRVFRLSSFSHNTLVIDGQLQFAKGTAKILSFRGAPAPQTVLDLSAVYTNASRVVRTGELLPTGEFRLTDTLQGLRPGARIRWGMVTRAVPTALSPGPLVLTEAGKRLTLTPLHTPATVWKIYETAKPPNEWDSPNPGTRMVGFEAAAPESGDLVLSVSFTP